MKRGIALSVVLLMCIGLAGCNDLTPQTDTTSEPSGTTTSTATTIDVGTAGVTLANFGRIQIGMSYPEVVNILGEEGTLASTTAAEPEVYQWSGNGGKITVFFVDDKVANAVPTGLK
jgi:hypothetical protein